MTTEFGSFAVTRVTTSFVPDTQGPPTRAKHDGAGGAYRLHAWVQLTNRRQQEGLAYSPMQLRLVDERGRTRQPDGSTLVPSVLPAGAGIDGQVWFDLGEEGLRSTGAARLELVGPQRTVARVYLAAVPQTRPRSSGDESDHSHPDDRGH